MFLCTDEFEAHAIKWMHRGYLTISDRQAARPNHPAVHKRAQAVALIFADELAAVMAGQSEERRTGRSPDSAGNEVAAVKISP